MSDEQKPPQTDKIKTQPMGFWIAIGTAIGAGLGVALDNIAVGVGVGIALGAAIGAAQNRTDKNK